MDFRTEVLEVHTLSPNLIKPQPARAHTGLSIHELELELDSGQMSALGFVDSHDREAQHPPFLGESKQPNRLVAAKAAESSLSDLYAVGDFTGALQLAQDLLAKDPDDAAALRYASNCRDVLSKMYTARLGSLHQRMVVLIASDQIRWLSLDHRAGFLLSLADGHTNIEDVLDMSGMPRMEALRIIVDLVNQKVVALEE
jgi:hypothetical protein